VETRIRTIARSTLRPVAALALAVALGWPLPIIGADDAPAESPPAAPPSAEAPKPEAPKAVPPKTDAAKPPARKREPKATSKAPAKSPARKDAAAPPDVTPFDLATVAKQARALAEKPYQEPSGKIPDWLREITYDQWRDIRFKADKALWADTRSPFQVQLFHPGLFYDRRVAINLVKGGKSTAVGFSPNLFDYGRNTFANRVPHDLGFAGFRLHFPIKTKDYRDEVIVFLGASYFRALGKNEVFGLSARGLAIDTAESWGEEFPFFKEFWLVEPDPKATSVTIYALLDSPRVAGAYRFVVTPGDATRVDVECRLFLRAEVKKLGIAAATSMFFHGENTPRHFLDFRPEVHDSDGLLMHLGNGEWLWRPVDNPERLHVSSLGAPSLAGFGMLQRDRDFDHYQDLETGQDHRPSLWQEPWGDWGPGRVELIEIPTDNDTNDNVVAFWVAEKPAKPGAPLAYGYTQWWYGEDVKRPPGGRAIATRRDAGTIDGGQRVIVDFSGGTLGDLPPDEVLNAIVAVNGGDTVAEIRDQHLVPNPYEKGWRLSFQLVPKTREPIELRAYLQRGDEVLTETWSYAIVP
jgi:periplasmic glucans biosynthesis protein